MRGVGCQEGALEDGRTVGYSGVHHRTMLLLELLAGQQRTQRGKQGVRRAGGELDTCTGPQVEQSPGGCAVTRELSQGSVTT